MPYGHSLSCSCQDCRRYNLAFQRQSNAHDDFQLYSSIERGDEDRDATRMRYDTARANLANERLHIQERTERERGEPSRSLYSSADRYQERFDPMSSSSRYERSARFDESQEHRYPTQYRDTAEYNRPHRRYTPGRYADTTGLGYYNTADPEADRHSDREETRRAREGTPYPVRGRDRDEMSAEEEDRRIRDLRNQIAQYDTYYGSSRP
ncbi:hypothetical protein MMC19_004702 [Ptychographa xylographoides]|nr:hypothetical protein [Ptychographa xylographoides]